jgi:hypothetical protein
VAVASPTLVNHVELDHNFIKKNVCAHLDGTIADERARVKSSGGNTGNGKTFKTVANISCATKAGVSK